MRLFPTKIARIVAICASLAIAFGVWTEVRAGTLPNVSGTWYANGNPANRCHISQSGSSVSLTNERGATATGSFVDAGSLATNWGLFGGGQITGRISSDLRTITWSNGTYWTRPSGSVSSGSTPAAAATPNPFRQVPLEAASVEGARAPIYVFYPWGTVKRDATRASFCLSFENKSSVTATLVRFDFQLLNRSGHVLDTWHFDRKGTFSPNVEIHSWHSLWERANTTGNRAYIDNCTAWRPDNERELITLSHTHSASYRIERVDFADGTTWRSP